MEESTYIGSKGYTIYKECLDQNEQKSIRDSLTVQPYLPKSPVQPASFPVYRESGTRLYMPKYYGLGTYGDPDGIHISDGEKIDVPFNGQLRDYQVPIVEAYMDSTKSEWGGGGLLDLYCGAGKTSLSLNIISRLKRKTLVIVHKSFLLNQWVERIEQFLPTAKIGKIQGQTLDVDGKDIVIGMLQSLSMKEYPSDLFSQFGLTIVDECHHISSEVFSRSLLHVVTKYTLGLSATMNRKDGLTPVFKMFLGEILYTLKREDENNVMVKAIEYKSNDPEFEEVVYDYRGNPQYSTMITKLCDYASRSEFILKVLVREMEETPDQHVMILGQNKSILKYLHDAIKHRKIATVGYYVGGMKESDLKETESKQVVIATYAMAAEGLDIKSLTTLFLATPRTDITQAVGRILRMKHERPLVVDFIDTHDLFQNQSKKRLTYYKKCKYSVKRTDSVGYMHGKWTDVKAGTRKKSAPKAGACLIDI